MKIVVVCALVFLVIAVNGKLYLAKMLGFGITFFLSIKEIYCLLNVGITKYYIFNVFNENIKNTQKKNF